MLFLGASRITFGNEGQVMSVSPDPGLFVSGLVLALLLGGLASAYPAWLAARRPIVESLRS